MSTNLVYALNENSGVVAEVPAHYLTHPILGKSLRPMRTGKPIAVFMEPALPAIEDAEGEDDTEKGTPPAIREKATR